MTKSKKLLSILLCVAMLLGTTVVGFTGVSAADSGIAKYADLDKAYDNFLYIATEYYDANGKLLTDGATLYQGDVITAKFYMKSDMDIHQFSHYVLYPTEAVITKVDSECTFKGTDTYTQGTTKYKLARLYSTKTGSFATTSDDPIAEYTVAVPSTTAIRGKDFGEYIPNIYAANNETAYVAVGKSKAYTTDFTLLINSTDKDNKIVERKFTGKVSENVKDVFIDGEKKYYSERVVGSAVVPPTDTNAYAWVKDGDTTKALNPFNDAINKSKGTPVTYNAVPGDTKINVTIDPKDYVFADGSTTPKNVTVDLADGINVDDYALKDAENVGWNVTAAKNTKLSDLARGTYKFGYIDDYTLTPMALDSITLKVATLDGEWVDFGTINGINGNTLSDSDIIALEELVNDNYDKLAETIGFEPAVGSATNYAKQFDTSAAVWDAFSADGTQIKNSATKALTFGTDNAIYLNTMIAYTYNMYITKVEDGKIVTDEAGKFGKAWDLVGTKAATINSIGKADKDGNTIYPNYTNPTYRVINVTTAEIDDAVKDVDKYNFVYSYKSGNADTIGFDNGEVVFGRLSDCTEGLDNTIEFYIDLEEREYVLSAACSAAENEKFNKGASQRDSQLTFEFGDTISLDSFEFDGFTVEDMMEDGSVVNNVGYRLKRIYLNDIDLTAGNTVEINAEFVDAADYDGKLVFLTEWEAIPQKFTVYYQNANQEWVVLTEKEFSGDEDVTVGKIYNDDLKQVATNDCHESVKPVFDGFSSQPGSKDTVKAKAYDGPMNLYVTYNPTERFCFVDYNDNTEASKRFVLKKTTYGAPLYDPDYDGPMDQSPIENYFAATTAPVSYPVKEQKKDGDKKPMYEYLYETVLDEEGNPVLDPVTGEPKTQVVVDEKGNKVYDTTKPIYEDLKGDPSQHRPYRNCEYIGYKIFYVDGVYENPADLPAESEWKEGYNANGGDDYGVYGTAIIQYQWKSDKDFLFRVYDENGDIFSALGKNLKWYYWNGNMPCDKKTAKLNKDPENMTLLMLLIKKETAELADGATATCFYLQAFTMGKPNLSPAFIPGIMPKIMTLIKGLL